MGSDDRAPRHERLTEMERFRAYVDAGPDLLFVLRLPSGLICEVNQTACDRLAQNRDALLGTMASQWIGGSGTQLETVLTQLSSDCDGTATMAAALIGCNQSPIPVELAIHRAVVEGEQVAIVSGRDITDLLARDALREREARLKSILRTAPTGLGVVADRVLLQVNERVCQMTGYTANELAGQKSRILYPTDEEFEYVGREKYRQICEVGTGTVETRWRRKDGSLIDVLLSSTPIDPDDLSIGVSFTALEITDRKQAEADREKLIAELEARNAELERFTYTVSHDLKSPLITIKGHIGMLAVDLHEGSSEDVEEDIRRISASADTMAELLKDLIDLSRVGHIVTPPTEVRIDELTREVVEAIRGPISERGVDVEIAPSLPVAYGDRLRLFEVLQNLIENAVKYMGKQRSPAIEIGAEPSGDMILVYVQDNGMGIEPAYQERIFGLFNQLDVGDDGTGIGLALAKRIVEVHGGRIWVESEGEVTGSRFCFTIPAMPSRGS